MKSTRFLSIPVLGVLLLIGFVYYITVFIFVEDWVGLQTSAGTLNALIFTFLATLCLFSFFVCVLTDPGHVPSSFSPDVEATAVLDQAPLENLSKCDKCHAYKPPRAHHCRVCKTCILRMDHHCLWINNCVGYWNYKAFFLLVLYATGASLYSSVMIVCSSFQKNWEFSGRISLKLFYDACLGSRIVPIGWIAFSDFLSFISILSGTLMFGLSAALGTLLGWHIYLATHNMTTIEYYEGIRAAWLAKKSGQSYRHPFDLSAYTNISSVFGPSILKWLCPTAVSHLKDGMIFPTSHHS